MRNIMIDAILSEMESNPNIFFLTADMGINLVEKIEEKYPDRFLNVGIAEQNLIGIAAGLVNIGYLPVVYTISNFLIHRCFEQIRNDICLHQYPIILLGTSTGYDNSALGPTHHIIDEWGALKSFPGIEVFCPSTKSNAKKLIQKVLVSGKPTYIRVPKNAHDEIIETVGQDISAQVECDVLLVTYGNTTSDCLEVKIKYPKISVLVIEKLNPLKESEIIDKLGYFSKIIVVEDHFPQTGLYSSISNLIHKKGLQIELHSLAPQEYILEVGASTKYFHKKFGIDSAGIIKYLQSINVKGI
jgi:transketolase